MKLMDSVIDKLARGIIIYQAVPNRPIIYANDSACSMLSFSSFAEFNEFYHNSYSNILYAEDLSVIEEQIKTQHLADVMDPQPMSYRMQDKSGKLIVMSCVGQVIDDEEYGRVCAVLFRPLQADAVPYVSDRITGLPGMREFLDYTEELASENEETFVDLHFSIVFFDIRHFKSYNIKYGIEAGDAVLKKLAEMIKNHFADAFISRFSDDHFVVLATEEDVIPYVDKVHDEFSVEYAADGMEVKIGIYYMDDYHVSLATACDYAKISCDDIHRSVDEYYRIFDEKLIEKHDIYNYVVRNLEQALENKYIKVYYQPVVRTIDGAFCGMEALARWDDPKMGMLSPAYFIQALEDNRLIAKLDMYMIEEICDQMRQRLDAGVPVVPVSFNLSRIDFSTCDVFERVEATLARFDIPRDMIRVEVTESMMVKENRHVQEELLRFKEVGYQVWMDDFGSGYSALNVLKDFDYDEIKIDMAFLSSFTEKSKQILLSIVRMAKSIGVQTLAEGVETREQYEYLRSIGCEKVQGYYFGKPMPLSEVLSHCMQEGLTVEMRKWEKYYDKIGSIDTETGRTCAIFEFDGKNFHTLQMNTPFREVLQSAGTTDMKMAEMAINDSNMPLYHQFVSLHQSITQIDQPYEMDFSVRNQKIRMRAYRIAKCENQYAYYVEVINLEMQEDVDYQQHMDQVFRTLSTIFDSLCYVDLEKNQIRTIMNHGNYALDDILNQKEMTVPDFISYAADHLIYSADRIRYIQWLNLEDLIAKSEQGGKGYISDIFRTKVIEGNYLWKVHRVIELPGTSGKRFIFAVSESPASNMETIAHLANTMGYDADSEQAKYSNMWHALIQMPLAKIFWKDKDRRFVGANRSFLDYYGMKDVSEIIGKTDEDMSWHVSHEGFESDELEVLREGKTILNHVGNCIIRGVQHKIMATKVPIFEKGQIVGLVGYFIDLNERARENEDATYLQMIDPLTGLMNNFGMNVTLADYLGEWETHHVRFAYVRIRIRHFDQEVQSFGSEITNHLLCEVADILKATIGTSAVCGRIRSSDFNIYLQYQSRSYVEKVVRDVCKQITAIHFIDEYPVTVHLDTRIVYAEQFGNVADMFSMIAEAEM